MKIHSKAFKIIRGVLITLAALVSVVVITLLIMYHNPLLTAFSVKQIGNEQAYISELHGNMYFDEFMKKNLGTRKAIEQFLYNKVSFNLYGKLNNDHGCSAFFAKTPDGDLLLCNDLDQHLTDEEKTPVVTKMKLGKKIIEMSNPGTMVDAADGLNFKEKLMINVAVYAGNNGINEDGLATAVATAGGSTCFGTDKNNLYDSAVTTAILSNASNVEEAIKFLEGYDVVTDAILSHYMIADAEGNVVVIEWVDGKMVVHRPEEDYMIMTNFLLSRMTGFGVDRYQSYEKSLSQCKGVLTEEEALKLLAENVIPGDENWSVVYNLTDRTATVCFRANYEKSYTYSLD